MHTEAESFGQDGVQIDPVRLQSSMVFWQDAASKGARLIADAAAVNAAKAGTYGANLALLLVEGEVRIVHWPRRNQRTPGDGQVCRTEPFVGFLYANQ